MFDYSELGNKGWETRVQLETSLLTLMMTFNLEMSILTWRHIFELENVTSNFETSFGNI